MSTSPDDQHRVEIYQRTDGLYGFLEGMRAKTYDGVPCWTPAWPSPDPICESAEIAEREARTQIEWLNPS